MKINIERLREDMHDDSMGAFFGGGFGGALIESFDIENASDDRILEMARRKGIDIGEYEEYEEE